MLGADISTQFPGAAGYLNTPSIGLPPQRGVDAVLDAITEWQMGRAEAADYDDDVARSRAAFAGLVGAPVETVAIGAQVSALIAIAATVLEPGSQVVVPSGEFTSVFFPLLARDELEVHAVPLDALAESITPATAMAAFSVAQSATGEVADCEAIRAAAAETGTILLADATQAVGWLPLRAADFDILVAGAYKWLLSPRGSAFMTMSEPMQSRARPLYAGWYSGEDPWQTIYDMPLRLARDARRFDLSPAWLSWVGTWPAIELLREIGVDGIHEHNVGLANAFRGELGLEPSSSAMVSLELDGDFDVERLGGLAVAFRAGRLRVGFHLYNTLDDVAAAAQSIRPDV